MGSKNATAGKKKAQGRRLDSVTMLTAPGMMLVLLGELAVRISPSWFPWLAPFGLAYGLGWVLLAAGVVWRMVSFRWIKAAFPLIVLAATWPSFSLIFSMGMGGGSAAPNDWGILSFNVRRLDEYGWLSGEETRRELAAWLSNRAEQIWCFQEFPKDGQRMLSEAGFSWQTPRRRVLSWPQGSGPALVTTWKVLEWDTWMFSEEAGQGRVLQADLETPVGVVRVFNVHLQSLYFSHADYDAVEEGPSRQEGLRLLGLVTRASGARALQAKELRRRMEESPHPVVLAGDFNDTPMSYAMRQLRKGRVRDAFEAASIGWGGTHIGTIPGLRIDGVLVDSTFSIHGHRTHDVVLSDHRPVTVTVGSGVDLD